MKLTKEYYKLFFESEFKTADQVKFLHFDFHGFVKGDKFEALRILIQQVTPQLEIQGQYVEDLTTNEVKNEQKGVIRVNCLDSIDRTNVAQSTISMAVFNDILNQEQVDIASHFGAEAHSKGIAFCSVQHHLIEEYKFFWRNAGDVISRQYTGTDSTISKMTQDGKEGFWGKLNHKMTSVKRVLKNSVYDNTD